MMRPLTRSLVLITLTLAIFGCGSKNDAPAAAETTATREAPPLPADVEKVSAAVNPAAPSSSANSDGGVSPAGAPASSAGDTNTISATGEFVSPVRSELAAKVIGRVSKMYVDEGSRVSRGQPLFELESDYPRLQLRAAEAEANRAKAVMDEAARDLERKKELIAKKSIPQATYDRSLAMYEQAQAARQAALANAALLRQQIADSVVRSPIDGVVAEKRTDVGQKLGDGGVAMVLVQTSPLRLRFQVPERYLGRIGRGDLVSARVDPYPTETFSGTIKTVGGVIDPQTRTMFAEAEFPNRDGRLRPGLFARIETKLD